MRIITLVLFIYLFCCRVGNAQDQIPRADYKKHGVVWSAGLFKSWLKDRSVGFDKVGNIVSPVFDEQKKMGFSIHSHYMFKPNSWIGLGIHLGMGLDVNSYIEAPVVLFGGSISFGSEHQFIIDVGWADAKRKIIPGTLRDQLMNTAYTDIPEIYNHTELNTGLYLGIGYRIF